MLLESLLGALALMVFGYLIGAVRIIKEGDEAIVERLGQYQRTLKSGLNFVIPLTESTVTSSMRERTTIFTINSSVTQDDVPLDLGIALFWRVADLHSTSYSVENIQDVMQYSLRSSVLSEVAKYSSLNVFKDTEHLNHILINGLKSEFSQYGVEVTKVAIQEILLSGVNQETPNVIQFTFLNGVQWVAFRDAFQLIVESDGIHLDIQGIEDLGEGVFKVRVPKDMSEAGKAEIYKDLMKKYEEEVQQNLQSSYQDKLNARDSEISLHREYQDNLWTVVQRLANPTFNINNTSIAGGDIMSNQENQAISTGSGSFINTGNQTITGSTINLGTISGNLTNSLTQLATQPQTQEIAAHLKEFQTAIETDSHLPEPDKIDALEQVAIVATASQDPTKPENISLTRKAMKLLKGTIDTVPKATSFIEACTKLLPLISKAFGL
jgi:regulator of protease activity HflC (stomatin/prohibitin superfamily)